MDQSTETPVQVQSINDYLLGPAIAERYNLWGPLKGERLLQFFEHLVTAHDRYTEALNDPVMVLKVLFRPPTNDDQRQRCADAAQQLLTEHKSIDVVLGLLDMEFPTFQRAIANCVSQSNTNFQSKLTIEGWRKVEQCFAPQSNGKQLTLVQIQKLTDVSEDDVSAIRALYGIKSARSNRIGTPRMPKEAHARMIELIREGKQGTEIAAVLKREHDVVISRSTVTKTRHRLDARGEL